MSRMNGKKTTQTEHARSIGQMYEFSPRPKYHFFPHFWDPGAIHCLELLNGIDARVKPVVSSFNRLEMKKNVGKRFSSEKSGAELAKYEGEHGIANTLLSSVVYGTGMRNASLSSA